LKSGVMLISVEKNFIFVHVAKTGGQSVKQALRPYRIRRKQGQWARLLSHLPVPEGPDAAFGPHVSARWAKLKLPRDFFDGAFKFGFVRNPYDLAVSRYAFVGGYPGHHRHGAAQKQTFREFLLEEKRRTAWRGRDQTAMLCGFDGELLVDQVYRFEAMEDAYRDIVRRLGLGDLPELRHKNSSLRSDYRNYYGEAERNLVEDIWKRDLESFGYAF
jgi:hypothetical protein